MGNWLLPEPLLPAEARRIENCAANFSICSTRWLVEYIDSLLSGTGSV